MKTMFSSENMILARLKIRVQVGVEGLSFCILPSKLVIFFSLPLKHSNGRATLTFYAPSLGAYQLKIFNLKLI
jgi:hypothetical protein